MIKAIIFDIDGVLIDSFEANLAFLQELFTKTGHRSPTSEEFRPIFHLNFKDVINTLCDDASNEEKARMQEMARNRRVKYNLSLVKSPDELEKVIEKLNKKYLLGIATGRNKETVYEVPRVEKLKKHFRVTVSYQDTENHKPHPEPLLFAAQGLQVKPGECIYVGDTASDLAAAHAAGMKAIIYSQVLEGADACTSDFNEIPKLITDLEKI